jgi:hypothetical protein
LTFRALGRNHIALTLLSGYRNAMSGTSLVRQERHHDSNSFHYSRGHQSAWRMMQTFYILDVSSASRLPSRESVLYFESYARAYALPFRSVLAHAYYCSPAKLSSTTSIIVCIHDACIPEQRILRHLGVEPHHSDTRVYRMELETTVHLP